MQDVEQHTLPDTHTEFRPGGFSFNWFGLILIPFAFVVYLIAMPFFVLFWAIEWFLPLQPDGKDLADEECLPALHARAKDSPSP